MKKYSIAWFGWFVLVAAGVGVASEGWERLGEGGWVMGSFLFCLGGLALTACHDMAARAGAKAALIECAMREKERRAKGDVL